ncbi:MAG: DUF4363 family protein [Christensenellaceae bacterium]|jgi:hypothetical protein|nr:DUF4363 family protein [Christensenellaceae bacterium]
MARIISMIAITVLLIGCGICEELFVRNTVSELNTYAKTLDTFIENNEENLNIPVINEEFDKLKSFWENTEHMLTYIVNFEKIRAIGEAIIKLEGAITQSDFSVAVENIKLIINYSENLNYVMGGDISNIL